MLRLCMYVNEIHKFLTNKHQQIKKKAEVKNVLFGFSWQHRIMLMNSEY